jgi:hypothetical protein
LSLRTGLGVADQAAGVLGGDDGEAQATKIFDDGRCRGRRIGLQPDVVRKSAAQALVNVIKVGYEKWTVLGVLGREEIEWSRNGEFDGGIFTGRADCQAERRANLQKSRLARILSGAAARRFITPPRDSLWAKSGRK